MENGNIWERLGKLLASALTLVQQAKREPKHLVWYLQDFVDVSTESRRILVSVSSRREDTVVVNYEVSLESIAPTGMSLVLPEHRGKRARSILLIQFSSPPCVCEDYVRHTLEARGFPPCNLHELAAIRDAGKTIPGPVIAFDAKEVISASATALCVLQEDGTITSEPGRRLYDTTYWFAGSRATR